MFKHVFFPAFASIVALMLSACAQGSDVSDPSQTAPETPVASSSSTSEPDFSLHQSQSPLVLDIEHEKNVVSRVAQEALQAFLQPALPQTIWFERLSGFLSAEAKRFYKLADNSLLFDATVLQINGFDDVSDFAELAQVRVETTSGEFIVLLTRLSPRDEWKIRMFTDPLGRR